MQKDNYAFVDYLINNKASFWYPLPVPDTRVFGHSNTWYPSIKICGYLQSLVLRDDRSYRSLETGIMYSVDHLFGTPPCYLFSMSRFEQKDFAALFYNQKTIEKCYNIMLKSPDHCLMSVWK